MPSEIALEAIVTVSNAMGLHARPAAQLAHIAGKYKASLLLCKCDGSGGEADCRSVLSMLMLAATQGTKLKLVASGENADTALAEAKKYFDGGFGE